MGQAIEPATEDEPGDGHVAEIVQGRNVIIWPEHDEPGTKYAEDVAKLAHEAGTASVSVVDVPDDFPKNGA